MTELYDFEKHFPKQCKYGLDRLLDYVVEEYGAIWTKEVSELLEDDAYEHFHFPVFNDGEEFVYYSEAMDYLVKGCKDTLSGAKRMLDVIECLNHFDLEELGEIQWSNCTVGNGAEAYNMANMLHYWIGYFYAVPKLQELNNTFNGVSFDEVA
tara:strand:- start:220 stop:678 length:459 start_codon:yes stop_codon:yes gene_type:complete